MVSKLKKTAALILASLLLLISFTGCWSKVEVEDLAIVLAVGIEKAKQEDQIKMIVQHIVPRALSAQQPGGEGPTFANAIGSGETLFEINRELDQRLSRPLFYAHNQLILISEDFARDVGINGILDFFNRNPQLRRTSWIAITKETDALKVLNSPSILEAIPSQKLTDIMKNAYLNSQSGTNNLGDFLELYTSESTQAFAGGVAMLLNTSTIASDSAGVEETSSLDEAHATGTAIFIKDKLVGWLNEKQSRGLLWVRNDVQGGILEVMLEENYKAAIEILRSSTEIKPEIKEGQIVFNLKISMEGNLAEQTYGGNLATPEGISQLEKLCNQEIENEIKAALTRAKDQLQADIFGFGEEIHRSYPQIWKEIKEDWRQQYYPQSIVTFEVDSKIRRTGLVTKPATPGRE